MSHDLTALQKRRWGPWNLAVARVSAHHDDSLHGNATSLADRAGEVFQTLSKTETPVHTKSQSSLETRQTLQTEDATGSDAPLRVGLRGSAVVPLTSPVSRACSSMSAFQEG